MRFVETTIIIIFSITLKRLPWFQSLIARGKKREARRKSLWSHQWRSQPDDSVPLYKYCHVYKLSTQSISKEMNNDNELKFALRDQIVGLATPLGHIGFKSYFHT
jgi:hypothetical protein